MTHEERLEIVATAFDRVMRELEGKREFSVFSDASMKAIVGAAVFLDRDPLDLAAQLRDGRLAEIIRAAEQTIPLPLDDPEPVRVSVVELLEETADAVDAERERFERRAQRIRKHFEAEAKRLRDRAHQTNAWSSLWGNVRSALRLDDEWQPKPPPAGRGAMKRQF